MINNLEESISTEILGLMHLYIISLMACYFTKHYILLPCFET